MPMLTNLGGMRVVWNLLQKGIWKLLLINWTELNSTEDALSLWKNQRPEEGLVQVPGPDLGLGPGPGLEAAQGLVEVVTKEVALNQEAEVVRLLRKTAPGAVQGQDLVTGTRIMTERNQDQDLSKKTFSS